MRTVLGTLVWFGAGLSITAGLVHVMTAGAAAPRSQRLAIQESQLQQTAPLDRRQAAVNERVPPKPR
jgi:hypothetical protein